MVAVSSALTRRVAPLRLAGDAADLAQEEAREVEQVDADIGDDQPFLGQEIGLVAIDVEAGAEADPRPARRADRAAVDRLAARCRIGDWKRKFSCTASQTPALRRPRPSRRSRSSLARSGFCTIVAMPRAIASSTSARCVSMPRDDVDEHRAARREHARGVGVERHAERRGRRARALPASTIADGGEPAPSGARSPRHADGSARRSRSR